jgi:hypothetical protein
MAGWINNFKIMEIFIKVLNVQLFVLWMEAPGTFTFWFFLGFLIQHWSLFRFFDLNIDSISDSVEKIGKSLGEANWTCEPLEKSIAGSFSVLKILCKYQARICFIED